MLQTARRLLEEQPFYPPQTEFRYRGRRIVLFEFPGCFEDLFPPHLGFELKEQGELLPEDQGLAFPVGGGYWLVGPGITMDHLRLAEAFVRGEVVSYFIPSLEAHEEGFPSPEEALARALEVLEVHRV